MSHTLNITVRQSKCNRYVICFSAHWFFCFCFQFFTHTCKNYEGLNTTHASIHVLVLDTKIILFELNSKSYKTFKLMTVAFKYTCVFGFIIKHHPTHVPDLKNNNKLLHHTISIAYFHSHICHWYVKIQKNHTQ